MARIINGKIVTESLLIYDKKSEAIERIRTLLSLLQASCSENETTLTSKEIYTISIMIEDLLPETEEDFK